MKFLLIFIFLLLFSCGKEKEHQPYQTSNSIKIASFNVQIFGESFMKDNEQVQVLVSIIKNYDILLLQEIRNKNGTAIIELIKNLPNYTYQISPRLGRTSSKEQYAFIYKKYLHPKCFQTQDELDEFEREPFICNFNNFSLLGIHIKPNDVVNELNTLYNLYQDELNNNLIILGDLNADCNYLTDYEYFSLPLSHYKWLIDKTEDTTTTDTNCAYDNIIMNDTMYQKIKNIKIFNFINYAKTKELLLKVSDHFPISFEIKDF